MKDKKLQTVSLYITAEDIENLFKQINSEQFNDVPIKCIGADFIEDDGSVNLKYMVYSHNEIFEELKGCRTRVQVMATQN